MGTSGGKRFAEDRQETWLVVLGISIKSEVRRREVFL